MEIYFIVLWIIMKLISCKVRDIKDYIQYEVYDSEIYPSINQKCPCSSLRKVNHLAFASLYLISVQVLPMKMVQTKTPTVLFLFGKQKPCRGTILLEMLGIAFNKKKRHQQNQFPSSFPSPSNNWPKLSLVEHTNQHLQWPRDMKETGTYCCFYLCE